MGNNPTNTKVEKKETENLLLKSMSNLNKKLQSSNLPPFLKNKYLLVAIFVFLLIVISFTIDTVSAVDNMIPTYEVRRDKFLVSITESGEIRAQKSITASAPRIRGTLKIIWMIPEGTIVDSGEVLVKFDPSEAMTKLQETEAQLEIILSEKKKLAANHMSATAQAESQLKSSELSYELSKLNLSQMKFEAEVKQQEAELQHQKNDLAFKQTEQEYESKKIIQKSEMDKMEIEIKQKRSDLESAKREMDQLTLTAPASGLVVYAPNWGNQGRKYAVGDQPWRGAGIIKLPDLSHMESTAFVNEVDVSKITKGLKVVVKLDAFRDSSFSGEITSVASIGQNKRDNSNIKVFEIVVDIKEASEILKPGMTSSNQIVINELPEVLFIPQEAVFEIEDKQYVYLLNGSSFDPVEVKLGEKGEDYIVVIEGISEYDKVALQDPTIEVEEDGAQSVETKTSMVN